MGSQSEPELSENGVGMSVLRPTVERVCYFVCILSGDSQVP